MDAPSVRAKAASNSSPVLPPRSNEQENPSDALQILVAEIKQARVVVGAAEQAIPFIEDADGHAAGPALGKTRAETGAEGIRHGLRPVVVGQHLHEIGAAHHCGGRRFGARE